MNQTVNTIFVIGWNSLLLWVVVRLVQAQHRYKAQLRMMKDLHAAAGDEALTGTVLIVANMRIRYTIRIVTIAFGLLIGVLGIASLVDPNLNRSVGYALLAYFFTSEIATGYLTARDLRVLDRIDVLDRRLREDARWRRMEAEVADLRAALGKRST